MRERGRAAGVVAAALLSTLAVALPSRGAEPAAVEMPQAAPAAKPLGGVAYEGEDRATVLLAPDAAGAVEEYANAGYRLRRGAAAGEWTVSVSLAPLASRAPFALPAAVPVGVAEAEVAPDARAAAAGAETIYGAVSGVLGWIVHHVAAPGELVLEAPSGRSGTGGGEAPATAAPPAAAASLDAAAVARLAVAMLGAVGVEARTVHGVVLGPPRPGAPRGPHVWIEARYPDRGWAFSDPLHHHHYVPATYLRLPVAPAAALAAALAARDDRRSPVDVYPPGGPGVGARRNDGVQVAAALRVVLPGAAEGAAVLVAADGTTRRKVLLGGEGVFVGLAGGAYTLQVLVPGRSRVERALELAPRERSAVFLGEPNRRQNADGGVAAGLK